MGVQSLVRPSDLRAVHWSVWVLLLLALGYLARAFTFPIFEPVAALGAVAPLFFAAAVVYVAPSDRRVTWAALALAGGPVLRLLVGLVPGQWIASAPILVDVGHSAIELGNVLLFVGVVLLGIALGGIRSAFGVTVVVFGGAVALADLVWVLAHPVADLPMFELVRSIGFATLTAIAWAFLLAAAIDALRSWVIVGVGLLFAKVVVEAALLWWAPGPGTNFDVISLAVNGMALVGWVAMIGAALRGELNATGPAGGAGRRAARRSSPRPRAG